jgi:hypothetical protein
MKTNQLERAVHDSYLRGLIQGKSPGEALRIIEREANLKGGRGIMKLRALSPSSYIK